MLQVIQHQKSGEIITQNVPAPVCPDEGILVMMSHTILSVGTEKTTVTKAKSTLLERAKKQPQDVKLVMDYIKKEGILPTYRRVRSALNTYRALGYSGAGTVIESKADNFSPGDNVAVAGAGLANHAEIVAIPKNLAVKMPAGVSFEEAAYTTLGAIAMQGFRQSEATLGDSVAVIGLGLIGIITVQILKAAGCRVVGFDLNESPLKEALRFGADAVMRSSSDSIKDAQAFTRGLGFDSVLICAGTPSNQPVELAMEICRKRGKVVVVGAVGMNIPRNPFYLKEIDFRISSSYGPGRYDPNYEEKGIDYPAAYVRYTENRNMQSFLDMIALGKINVNDMTSHTFDVKDAAKAYELVIGENKEPFLGIILKYDTPSSVSTENIIRKVKVSNESHGKGAKISFIGAGTFAQNYLLPPLQKLNVSLRTVATTSSVNSRTVAEKFSFEYAATGISDVINDDATDAIFVATRHDSHAEIVIEALKAGKAVFTEKPLAINFEELLKIDDALAAYGGRVMVGFNRRFSKDFSEIAKFFASRQSPLTMLYRVNAGFIPKSSWVQQKDQGGRIVGEVCHFIDTMCYLTSSLPISVSAQSVSSHSDDKVDADDVAITIKFGDGSLGSILYTSSGDKSLPKEYFEANCDGSSAVMNNFDSVDFYRSASHSTLKTGKGKGINEEIALVYDAIEKGHKMPIDYHTIRQVTLATFAALRSLETNSIINLNEYENDSK